MPYPIHPKGDNIIKISCAQLKGEKEGGSSTPFNKTRKHKKPFFGLF